ncbi:MAG: hypothetical protein WC634_00495 [archaeon]
MPNPKRRRLTIRRVGKERASRKRKTASLNAIGAFVRRRLATILEPTGIGLEARISKGDSRILGVGGAQLVVDLGQAKIGAKAMPIVAKLFLNPERPANHHLIWFDKRKPIETEATALFLRRQGFPVVMHSAIPYAGKLVIISENLKAGGNKLFEAFNFDFSRLKNGAELEQQFRLYKNRLLDLEADELLSLDRHIKGQTGGQHEGEERTFYIVQDQKTGVGRLVVADLDHIKITGETWNQFSRTFAPLRKKFKIRDSIMYT